MKKITIIIPIFNESESIFELIEEINNEFKSTKPQILVVDDGSTDDFKKKIKTIKKKIFLLFRTKIISGNVKPCILE